MVDIKKELDTSLNGKRIYIQVIEGGGTGNEAAAFRMGRYLESVFTNVEVRYLIGLLPESLALNTIKNKEELKGIVLDVNKTTLVKLKALGVDEGKVIKKLGDLSSNRDFIVSCSADGNENSAITVEKFLEKIKGASLEQGKYLGFINLEPFAWHSECRFIRFAGKTYSLNLPKLADYPDLTISTSTGSSAVGSSILSLLGKLDKQVCDVMLIYGLHALYDSEDGSDIVDEAHCFWIARAFAALALGVADYAVKSKKHAVLLALHPKNQFDEKYIGVTGRKIVIYVSRGRQPAIDTSPGTIHCIPMNCVSMSELVTEIIKAKAPQLIVLRKTDDVSVTPDEFSRLLDMTTLPTVSEGANTIGQLYGKGKTFFTIGAVEQQVVNIKTEIDASNKWYNLVNESVGVEIIKQAEITYSSDVVLNELINIKKTFLFAGRSIAELSYECCDKKGEYSASMINAAQIITNYLGSDEWMQYVKVVGKFKKSYPDYISNQVLMSFWLLCRASSQQGILKKL
ncbi:hypothetical protein [Musicola paradisiaca]|uniref:Uncharacterized protein n=1 Tax=Musicola paradisiaca (strain Ech703) TaxID=579405 RepID=C6CA54_MUSP7|nr:hypothetical protein [Musicola paradisiaca]ACS84529.1 hypothetical protein Dd703_0718 [Musicola paradisiaca Ech703]